MSRILIVEDEPRLSQLVADYLQHARYDTEQTDSAQTAMALARTVALILLDLMLPDGDGMDVYRQCIAQPGPHPDDC